MADKDSIQNLDRRSILRGIAGGAVAVTAFGGLAAGDSGARSEDEIPDHVIEQLRAEGQATDTSPEEDCEWEYRCGDNPCTSTSYYSEERYCCTNPDTGQRFCDDWQQMSICC